MKRVKGQLVYIPVQGPRLKQLRPSRQTNTGVPGISFGIRMSPSGRKVNYFFTRDDRRSFSFNIDTLGREEAWNRALRVRAQHEREVTARNAAIMAARHTQEEEPA